MARRGRLLPDLRISAPSVVARILAWVRDATDFRPSINGVGGACATRRTVWESSREPWRDGGRLLPDLRISAAPMLARILAWARDATDFRPSINGGATVPLAAHRLGACRRAMAHPGRRFADFRDSVTRTSTCTRCMQSRMQLSSLHVNDVSDSPGFFEGFFEGLFSWTVWEAFDGFFEMKSHGLFK